MKKTVPALPRPKYIQFADAVRAKVRSGELQPGDRLPSLSEVREQWGIGRSVWERAHELLEKDGLVERQHGRGTFVARPRKASTGCIGFFRYHAGQSTAYPYWSHLIDGMQAAAAASATEIMLINPSVDAFRWERVDGVIVLGRHHALLRQVMPAVMPCVSVINQIPNVTSVSADEYSGMYNAVKHLLGLGHRKVAYLKQSDDREGSLRLQGYLAALSEFGISTKPEWMRELTGTYDKASVSHRDFGLQSMRLWLSQGFGELGCTALLTQNDESALGAMEVLREAGYGVPDNISIIGFDGTEIGEYSSPPLTTVVMPLYEMGQKAVEALLQMTDAGAAQGAASFTLPTSLKIRQTTAPPPRPTSQA